MSCEGKLDDRRRQKKGRKGAKNAPFLLRYPCWMAIVVLTSMFLNCLTASLPRTITLDAALSTLPEITDHKFSSTKEKLEL